MQRCNERRRNPWYVQDCGVNNNAVGWFVVIMVLVAFFGSVSYAVSVQYQNDQRQAELQAVRMLDTAGADKQGVKLIAASLLSVRDEQMSQSHQVSDAFIDRLRETMNTGDVPEVATSKGTWGEFASIWAPIYFTMAYIIACAFVCIGYVTDRRVCNEHLADFQWRSLKGVLFVLCTLPLLPAYLISAARMKRGATLNANTAKHDLEKVNS